ncbi:helix-turn-helix transcriptional regulator [Thomasclavelia sp.]|uniref:helix-turn-helix domain-containing protein n=1 Tax=Thomasclavelia sp. TaxID=3025757 RepID=UPI0025F3B82D|nr:helix-turn-helix transcriptional regulator [Thomasclavelia sp.]
MMDIGKRIKILRKRKNMTQKELGILLGFKESTAVVRITQYEKNSRMPRDNILQKISNIFDVKKEVLTSSTGDPVIDLCIDMYWLSMEGIAPLLVFSFFKSVNELFPLKYGEFNNLVGRYMI